MATLATLAWPLARMPHQRPGPTVFMHAIAAALIPTTGAGSADGDVINLATLPAGWHVVDGWFQIAGTLGTSCTLTLRHGTTAMTAASTAAQANNLRLTAPVLADLANNRTINALVGGAAITAQAKLTLWLTLFEYRPLAV